MNSRLLLSSSAVFLGAIGISLTFFPDEISTALQAGSGYTQISLQVLGSLYFGFAMLNWMAQWSVIGGIYNRPIAIANFSHFLISALALVKWVSRNPDVPYPAWALAIFYCVLALLFGSLLFRQPQSHTRNKPST